MKEVDNTYRARQTGKSIFIIIPKEVADKFGIVKGQLFKASYDEDKCVIVYERL